MSVENCRVVALGDEIVEFACGHSGPAEFKHDLNGHEYRIVQEILDSQQLCGECYLEKALDGATFCARCGRPIFKGQDCIDYDGEICCLSVGCGPGPVAYMPGIWDGERFVDGIIAGTVRTVRIDSLKVPREDADRIDAAAARAKAARKENG